MKIILRTHGGLGNQLFQILYARLLAKSIQCELYELHDSNYARIAYREPVPYISSFPKNKYEIMLSALRLSKVATRILGHEVGYVRVGNAFYLDAYFQNIKYFSGFDMKLIRICLEEFRDELQIGTVKSEKRLLHLRLGDFFKSKNEALIYTKIRLEDCPKKTKVISNENSIITDKDIFKLLERSECVFIDTSYMSGHEVLRFMCLFKEIDANESTLTFWASVFGSEVSLISKDLRELSEFFAECMFLN